MCKMKRIKLTVAYDGTEYSGWQIQPNAPTIEAELDAAIEQLTGEILHVTGASRTDAGVHALGNVAVFDTESTIPGNRWAYAVNRYLPPQISVVNSREVKPDFHPRHCNTRKIYEYKILNTKFPIPQLRNYAWYVPGCLDVNLMRRAAEMLIGEHDYKSFCCVRTQAESTVRTVYSIELEETPVPGADARMNKLQAPSDSASLSGPQVAGESAGLSAAPAQGEATEQAGRIITIRITGNGFLYNMVRIITGTLVWAGKGFITPEDVKAMLEKCDRNAAGQTAPPQGLTLVNIEYVDGDDKEYNKSDFGEENCK